MPGENEDDVLVMSLVESALERPDEERQSYLRAACGHSPALYEDVLKRVEWEKRMGSFLLEPLMPAANLREDVNPRWDPLLDPRLLPGARLADRFRIVREVGSGGMGVVYEAIDEQLDRRIAIKCAKQGYWNRLSPEVRSAREVSHFNVCKVYDLHSGPNVDFLTMELIEGETLSAKVKRTGPLPRPEARDIARQICAGLAQAHLQGVVHGDLKCSNVILAQTSEGRLRAVITDFGLARMRDVAAGQTGGTYDYMAPEMLMGEPATVASDIYALGVLFHVMLTGRAPARAAAFQGKVNLPNQVGNSGPATAITSRQIVEADWRREIEPLPGLWENVVARALAAHPGRRFASAEAVSNALETRRRFLKAAAAVVMAAGLVAGGREWRNQAAVTPVRLAVLPLSVEGDHMENAAGIGLEVADRLAGARRKFTVLSPREEERNQAVTPEKVHTSLGATHVLETHVQSRGDTMTANASLVDLQSGRIMGQLQGTYSTADSEVLAQALIGTVTEAFRLPSKAVKESMAATAYPYYLKAIDLLRQDNARNADQVIALLTHVVELDPRSALPYAGIAEAQIQKLDRGDGSQWLDAAEATVAKAVSINPGAVPVLLASAEVERRHGRYEPALHQLTRATEIAPNDSETWRRLAQCYEQANRPEEAVATYRKAIEAQPNYYRHYLDFGTFYMNRGQFERAEAQYRRVIEIAPDLASGHMNLGLALMREGRFPEAEPQLLQALNLRKSPSLLLNIGAMYYEEGRFEEAARYFEQSVAAGVMSPTQYRDLGDAKRHLGRPADAKSAYVQGRKLVEEEITRNPRQAASRVLFGYFWAFLGDRQRADFEISQALATEPENGVVMRDAVIAYEFMGQRDQALAVLRKAHKHLLEELSRQPDVKTLQTDSRFRGLLSSAPAQ